MTEHLARSEQPGILVTDWFPGEAAAVGLARRFVRGVLGADWPGLPDVLVMVSEITTNAISHTASGSSGGWFDLTVSVLGNTVRTAVTDQGGPSQPRIPGGGEGAVLPVGGRGLRMVDDLADAWGHTGDAMGRVVWFQVRATQDG